MVETARARPRRRGTAVAATVVAARTRARAPPDDEHDWAESIAGGVGRAARLGARSTSEHPLFIGYTSGTTGQPKGVLHVHGGFLVKIAAEVAYQVDCSPARCCIG